MAILMAMLPYKTKAATDVSEYDYALYTADMPAMAGRQMVMTLSMRNATLISGYQADLVLPEGFSVATIQNEMGDSQPQVTLLRTLPSRHTLSVSLQSDGSYRLLSTSTKNRNYGGYDGSVAYITLNVAPTVEDGEYDVFIRHQEMAEVNNVSHRLAETHAMITVTNPQDILDRPETEVDVTNLAGISHTLYATNFRACRGRQAKVDIRLRNADEVTGFQTDILLPTGFTLARDDKGQPMMQLSNRTTAARHAMNIAQQADGSYRLIVISTSNLPFGGNDGVIATLTFDVSDQMQTGEYKAILRKQELVKADNSSYHPENVTARVRVEMPAYYYDMMNFEPYTLYACNKGVQPGGSVTLEVGMANLQTICGFQADLVLPEGVTVATMTDAFGDEVPMISYGSRTSADRHAISCVRQNDGTYRILCASTSNKTLSGHLGEVFKLTLNVAPTVKKKNYSIYFVNQEFGEANNVRHVASNPFISRLYVRNVPPIMGDIFQDGKMDCEDVQALLEILLHSDSGDYDEEAGDSNHDGHFSITDIIGVIKGLKR